LSNHTAKNFETFVDIFYFSRTTRKALKSTEKAVRLSTKIPDSHF